MGKPNLYKAAIVSLVSSILVLFVAASYGVFDEFLGFIPKENIVKNYTDRLSKQIEGLSVYLKDKTVTNRVFSQMLFFSLIAVNIGLTTAVLVESTKEERNVSKLRRFAVVISVIGGLPLLYLVIVGNAFTPYGVLASIVTISSLLVSRECIE